MSNTIKIPFSLPSRNDTDKMHWSAIYRLRKGYQPFNRQQMSHFRLKKATPDQVFSIEITTFRKQLLDDEDNVDAKRLLDALTHEGFIFDDARKYIGKPSISQMKASEECTIITREEI